MTELLDRDYGARKTLDAASARESTIRDGSRFRSRSPETDQRSEPTSARCDGSCVGSRFRTISDGRLDLARRRRRFRMRAGDGVGREESRHQRQLSPAARSTRRARVADRVFLAPVLLAAEGLRASEGSGVGAGEFRPGDHISCSPPSSWISISNMLLWPMSGRRRCAPERLLNQAEREPRRCRAGTTARVRCRSIQPSGGGGTADKRRAETIRGASGA